MKSHRTDGLSLTFGLIFLVVVGWWMAADRYNVDLPNAGWFVAAALIVLGVLGLIGALRANRQPPEAPTTPAEAPTTLPADEDLPTDHRG